MKMHKLRFIIFLMLIFKTVQPQQISIQSSPQPLIANYLGCYGDGTPRDLSVLIHDGSGPGIMTNQLCLSLCFQNGFRYFGTQSFYGMYGISATGCITNCAADNSQMCGGYWVNSVYGIVMNDMSKCNYFVKLDKSLLQIQPSSPVSTVVSTVYNTNGVYLCLGLCRKTVNCNMVSYSTLNNQCVIFSSQNGYIDASNANSLTDAAVKFYKRNCQK